MDLDSIYQYIRSIALIVALLTVLASSWYRHNIEQTLEANHIKIKHNRVVSIDCDSVSISNNNLMLIWVDGNPIPLKHEISR